MMREDSRDKIKGIEERLLKEFIKAFRKAPNIVVTDQDGAMRNAIEAEFVGSKHRLCMWHITQKLPAKICSKIYDETDFKEKLNKIVWNMYIGPEEFVYIWEKLMEEFKLEIHKWLTKMFNIRSTWIPAYFIDSPLCGLIRTTSRHVQERIDHKTIDIIPKLKTLLKIERHASNVYTRSLFELVQKEIFVGLFYWQIDSKCLVEGFEVCIIKESPYVYEMPNKKKKKPQSVDKGNDKAEENNKVDMFFIKDGLYKVLQNVGDGSVVCSCQLFMRVGILCKHIFCVFKNDNVEMIPQQYILRRWTKNLIPAALRNKRNRYGEKNVVLENYANKATSIVDHCMHLLSIDEPRLGSFVEKLKSLKKEVEADCLNPPSKNKTDIWSSLLEFRSQGVGGLGIGEVILSTFELLQMLGFFLQIDFTLILATLDGLDEGLLGDVIGEDECDEDEYGCIYNGLKDQIGKNGHLNDQIKGMFMNLGKQ
ncbi:protein FAR1-related sequence 5 [Tanacetum coccineum]